MQTVPIKSFVALSSVCACTRECTHVFIQDPTEIQVLRFVMSVLKYRITLWPFLCVMTLTFLKNPGQLSYRMSHNTDWSGYFLMFRFNLNILSKKMTQVTCVLHSASNQEANNVRFVSLLAMLSLTIWLSTFVIFFLFVNNKDTDGVWYVESEYLFFSNNLSPNSFSSHC